MNNSINLSASSLVGYLTYVIDSPCICGGGKGSFAFTIIYLVISIFLFCNLLYLFWKYVSNLSVKYVGFALPILVITLTSGNTLLSLSLFLKFNTLAYSFTNFITSSKLSNSCVFANLNIAIPKSLSTITFLAKFNVSNVFTH